MRALPPRLLLLWLAACGPALDPAVGRVQQPLPSTTLVISQVFGAGGAIGTPSPPPYRTDFVELHNTSGATVALGNTTVQYASALGTNWLVADFDPGASVPAGGYHLIAFSSGMSTRGAPLPTPDTVNPLIDLARSDFKLAVVDGVAPLSASCPLATAEAARVIDFVGAGTANCFEAAEGAADAGAPAPSVTTGLVRRAEGCLDTDVNALDFEATTPVARNSASPAVFCFPDGGSSGTPDAGSVPGDAGLDAGPAPFDAGFDAGAMTPVDAGRPDAGLPPPDAGAVVPDAGPSSDAGSPPDAGTAPPLNARSGCRCSSVDASTFLLALGVVALARRRR